MSGIIATFKTRPEFYEAEESGKKPCTLRIIDEREVLHVDIIRMECVGRPEYFERVVTWQGTVMSGLGKALVLYCWKSK